ILREMDQEMVKYSALFAIVPPAPFVQKCEIYDQIVDMLLNNPRIGYIVKPTRRGRAFLEIGRNGTRVSLHDVKNNAWDEPGIHKVRNFISEVLGLNFMTAQPEPPKEPKLTDKLVNQINNRIEHLQRGGSFPQRHRSLLDSTRIFNQPPQKRPKVANYDECGQRALMPSRPSVSLSDRSYNYRQKNQETNYRPKNRVTVNRSQKESGGNRPERIEPPRKCWHG
uniref:Uncharacterized protein n=1 Tax=Acrobeloides nanus TaxID=290746 RepID=A0A914DP88_9BILA